MTAQIIDFVQKRKERELKKLTQAEAELVTMTAEQLEKFSVNLRQHIIKNADEVQPCSYDDSKVVVTVDGVEYVV